MCLQIKENRRIKTYKVLKMVTALPHVVCTLRKYTTAPQEVSDQDHLRRSDLFSNNTWAHLTMRSFKHVSLAPLCYLYHFHKQKLCWINCGILWSLGLNSYFVFRVFDNTQITDSEFEFSFKQFNLKFECVQMTKLKGMISVWTLDTFFVITYMHIQNRAV